MVSDSCDCVNKQPINRLIQVRRVGCAGFNYFDVLKVSWLKDYTRLLSLQSYRGQHDLQ